jgi:hypothetical protein
MCKQWQKSNKSYFREQKSAQAKQKKKKKKIEKKILDQISMMIRFFFQ